MNYSKNELIQYRINRAEESLEEAKLLANDEYWNSTINRLYYCCYYIISALLVAHGLDAKTHNGVKTLFNRHFVKTGTVDKSLGTLFSELFNKRQEGDYLDFIQFERDQIQPLISKTETFLTKIKKLTLA